MNETFINISKIIERDSKNTTYKFALLRGTIDTILDNSPFINAIGDHVEIPLGLLIEKWVIYYYPILDSKVSIPQIHGSNNKIAFQNEFLPIIHFYNQFGGLSALYNDLRVKGVSPTIQHEFLALVRKLKDTITKMPMRYIGGSIADSHYSIFKVHSNANLKQTSLQNAHWLINSCGTYTIPKAYYEAFKVLGSFVSGTDNILFKWAEFSVNASNSLVDTSTAIHHILKSPITERDVAVAKNLYKTILKDKGKINCVWTGETISNYDVDHVIPFSVWKNNDLWNLLPAKPSINNSKRDKIPATGLLLKQKQPIIHYWETICSAQPQRFLQEIQITLLGNKDNNNWQHTAFNQLLNTSKYLIETRGFTEWKL